MTPRTIAVVSAGLGTPSSTRLLADRLAAAAQAALRARGVDVEPRVIDVRDRARDLTDHLLLGFPSPALRETIETVVTADGLIAVSPIYSGSYSGLFKTFFDVLERDALAGMPVLVAATAGTARHSLALDHALRPLFAYLGAAVVPTGVFAATADWGQRDAVADDSPLAERIERAGRELAEAVASGRHRATTDRFKDPIPFARLLAGDEG